MNSENHSTSSSINIRKESNRNDLRNNIIFAYIAIIFLCLESIYILFSALRKGIFKQEILTKKSDIGFDIIIKN